MLQGNRFRFALPLIALPGISPRVMTGRKTPVLKLSPITNVAEKAPRLRPAPSPRHYTGRRGRRRMRGSANLDNSPVEPPVGAFLELL
ncbi:hypothetical protein, partial [Mesorhizobium sp.]|uniref:hypothetical protein n=1 Tax=Mesorhizobium sp. TaxID=1871066 RepID=UPI0025E83803